MRRLPPWVMLLWLGATGPLHPNARVPVAGLPSWEVQADADLVVSGTVICRQKATASTWHRPPLRGDTDQPDIRIWLKTADYRRPEPELFPVGSSWVWPCRASAPRCRADSAPHPQYQLRPRR